LTNQGCECLSDRKHASNMFYNWCQIDGACVDHDPNYCFDGKPPNCEGGYYWDKWQWAETPEQEIAKLRYSNWKDRHNHTKLFKRKLNSYRNERLKDWDFWEKNRVRVGRVAKGAPLGSGLPLSREIHEDETEESDDDEEPKEDEALKMKGDYDPFTDEEFYSLMEDASLMEEMYDSVAAQQVAPELGQMKEFREMPWLRRKTPKKKREKLPWKREKKPKKNRWQRTRR